MLLLNTCIKRKDLLYLKTKTWIYLTLLLKIVSVIHTFWRRSSVFCYSSLAPILSWRSCHQLTSPGYIWVCLQRHIWKIENTHTQLSWEQGLGNLAKTSKHTKHIHDDTDNTHTVQYTPKLQMHKISKAQKHNDKHITWKDATAKMHSHCKITLTVNVQGMLSIPDRHNCTI